MRKPSDSGCNSSTTLSSSAIRTRRSLQTWSNWRQRSRNANEYVFLSDLFSSLTCFTVRKELKLAQAPGRKINPVDCQNQLTTLIRSGNSSPALWKLPWTLHCKSGFLLGRGTSRDLKPTFRIRFVSVARPKAPGVIHNIVFPIKTALLTDTISAIANRWWTYAPADHFIGHNH